MWICDMRDEKKILLNKKILQWVRKIRGSIKLVEFITTTSHNKIQSCCALNRIVKGQFIDSMQSDWCHTHLVTLLEFYACIYQTITHNYSTKNLQTAHYTSKKPEDKNST